MEFRKARKSELGTLNKISVVSKKYWRYPTEWMEKWKDDLTIDTTDFLEQEITVVEIDSIIVGFCSIIDNPEDYEILHLWVLPDYIGQGAGKQLLNYTLNKFVKQNKDIIVVADPNAEAFYNSQGFRTFDKAESYPKGRYLPIMKKSSSLII